MVLHYLTCFEVIPLSTVLFISSWLYIKSHVRKNGPIKGAATFLKYNDLIYSLASFALLIYILSSPSTPLPDPKKNATPSNTHDTHARLLYHLSKFYEYIDVLGVLANGGLVNLHFGFHHLTTPYLTYVRVLNHYRDWKYFAALNCLHHTFMYAYFGGVQGFRRGLPFTGYLQLLAGIGYDGYIAWKKLGADVVGDDLIWPNVVTIGLLVTYSVLFAGGCLCRQG